MAETRNSLEGKLYWVAASGSGTTWATASGAATGLLGYVSDFNFSSAQQVQQIMDRGVPSHHKQVAKDPISVSWSVQWGVTGDYPTFASGSGATQPMIHLELQSTAPEADGLIAYQFHGVAMQNYNWTEGTPANTQQWQGVALAMNGPTGSGYVG